MYIRTVKASIFVLVLLVSLFTLVACSSSEDAETTGTEITDIVWQWERVTDRPSGETTTVPNPENYTLIFKDDDTFSGQADCNQISGTYSQEGGFTLTVGPSTMAFCGEDSLDQQYIDLLNGVVAGGPDGAGGFALEWAGAEKRMEFSNGGAA
jgi:heat shock protein HslJ